MKRPARIRIYDNGNTPNATADRYTVVYMDRPEHLSPYRGQSYTSIGMSADPFHPQGIGQHGPAIPGKHLGKRIPWEDLPEPCQRAVILDVG